MNRGALFCLPLVGFLSFGRVGAQQPGSLPGAVYIQAGRLLADPADGEVDQRKTLIVQDGKVLKVEDGCTNASGAQVIDLRGSLVMPRLIDGHVDLKYREGRESLDPVVLSPPAQAIVGVGMGRSDLMAGLTTVVDLDAEIAVIFALRQASEAGTTAAPRIIAAGDYIMASPMPPPFNHSCSFAHKCTRKVREQIAQGADVIKLIATGGVLSLDATVLGLRFTDEKRVAIVRTASAARS